MATPAARKFCYRYPHPAVTVDCVIFAVHEDDLKVLLIQRMDEPFKERWAIPGGFVKPDETLEEGARRVLHKETRVNRLFLEQLYAFGGPARDPRERVISVAYYSLVNLRQHFVSNSSDALNTSWFSVCRLPPLAFDHSQILNMAVRRLRDKVLYAPVVFELLPPAFRLAELQHVYEIILRQRFDAEKFRARILALKILKPLKSSPRPGAERLYEFDRERHRKMAHNGIAFKFKPDAAAREEPVFRRTTRPAMSVRLWRRR
ncbi:MAG: NUDIX hydrolase [Verrucomicrobia bacterium]|nr:NUDIX hydrolase [Verrucomicrobiota bacterium]